MMPIADADFEEPRRSLLMKAISASLFAMRFLLWPLALSYALISLLRNICYDHEWFLRTYQVGRPVISIGNITAGGTGKTPFADFLIQLLSARGHSLGVISRGYRGQVKGIAKIDITRVNAATYFGDEPTWLAQRFPKIPVYVGTNKVDVANELVRQEPSVELILADDAFQHRRLKRSFNIIILDATEPQSSYWPLPVGRGREDFEYALERASAIVFNKVNLANPGNLLRLKRRVQKALDKSVFKPVLLDTQMILVGFSDLHSGEVWRSSGTKIRVILVSGIARPQTFLQLVLAHASVEVLQHKIYGDHHAYSQSDFREIENLALALGADRILVTQKDAVKMKAWQPQSPLQIAVSQLELAPVESQAVDELYEKICQPCFS
jgi:tetraacyldisaccharide 4'-kinase